MLTEQKAPREGNRVMSTGVREALNTFMCENSRFWLDQVSVYAALAKYKTLTHYKLPGRHSGDDTGSNTFISLNDNDLDLPTRVGREVGNINNGELGKQFLPFDYTVKHVAGNFKTLPLPRDSEPNDLLSALQSDCVWAYWTLGPAPFSHLPVTEMMATRTPYMLDATSYDYIRAALTLGAVALRTAKPYEEFLALARDQYPNALLWGRSRHPYRAQMCWLVKECRTAWRTLMIDCQDRLHDIVVWAYTLERRLRLELEAGEEGGQRATSAMRKVLSEMNSWIRHLRVCVKIVEERKRRYFPEPGVVLREMTGYEWVFRPR